MSDATKLMEPYLRAISTARVAFELADRGGASGDAAEAESDLFEAYAAAIEQALVLLGPEETAWLDTADLQIGDTITNKYQVGRGGEYRFKVKARHVA